MVYKTLHWYIIRELLRIFLMTASALTTLLAFGGMFKPITKQGVDVGQLMVIMMNLMPAMLAYAIPIAALFAAVLVYWRMSTDNELTACRAGGISFVALVVPAFALGLLVASIDLVFVNFVVPRFLQRTEQAIRRDIGSLIVNQIQRQGTFEFQNFISLYADAAHLEKSENGVTEVVLDGMAGNYKGGDKAGQLAVARQAHLIITDRPETDTAEITGSWIDGAAFNPSMQKVSGTVDSTLFGGRPWVVESLLKSRPKFLNLRELIGLNEATHFPPVARIVDQIRGERREEEYAAWLESIWKNSAGKITLRMIGDRTSRPEVFIQAPNAGFNPQDGSLVFRGNPGVPMTVRTVSNGRPTNYTADAADVSIFPSADPSGEGTTAMLALHGNVTQEGLDGRPIKRTSININSILLSLPPQIASASSQIDSKKLIDEAGGSSYPAMRDLARQANDQITRLYLEIDSELNSRGSFSLSCLMLVLFGAALGIILRGKNPLAVFVVGFVPAVLLVLLITAGRQLAEGSASHKYMGITLIWAGNGILLLLVAAVYAKLLRR